MLSSQLYRFFDSTHFKSKIMKKNYLSDLTDLIDYLNYIYIYYHCY